MTACNMGWRSMQNMTSKQASTGMIEACPFSQFYDWVCLTSNFPKKSHYAGSTSVFSEISRRQDGHFAGASRM
jgi:hypothetical protein